MEEIVRGLVRTALGGNGWEIRRPPQGWSASSYIAVRGAQRVFVKFGTPVDILYRLADLGVAPTVLAAGASEGIPYAIQEFVEGSSPDRPWIQSNPGGVVGLLKTVHRDAPLRGLLVAADRPVRQLRDLEVSHRIVADAFGDRSALPRAYAWMTAHPPSLAEHDLTPTHGDVNYKNVLIAPPRIVMVDWEDIALADPARDLGPLLWWYFPPAQWPAALGPYGMEFTAAFAQRIYWWAACVSLDITAGLLERGHVHEAVGFLGDVVAAAAAQPNPRPHYAGLKR